MKNVTPRSAFHLAFFILHYSRVAYVVAARAALACSATRAKAAGDAPPALKPSSAPVIESLRPKHVAYLESLPLWIALPVAIFRFLGRPGELNLATAYALAVVLMAVTVVSILLVERIRLRRGGWF